jgi:hypothetical protein
MAEQALASGLAANVVGLNIHADVMSNAKDRGKLEKLCCYFFEESSALGYQKKLVITTYGKVRYPFKTLYSYGTTGDRRSHLL